MSVFLCRAGTEGAELPETAWPAGTQQSWPVLTLHTVWHWYQTDIKSWSVWVILSLFQSSKLSRVTLFGQLRAERSKPQIQTAPHSWDSIQRGIKHPHMCRGDGQNCGNHGRAAGKRISLQWALSEHSQIFLGRTRVLCVHWGTSCSVLNKGAPGEGEDTQKFNISRGTFSK